MGERKTEGLITMQNHIPGKKVSEFDHLSSFYMGGKGGNFSHSLQMGKRITFKSKKECERLVHQSNENSLNWFCRANDQSEEIHPLLGEICLKK